MIRLTRAAPCAAVLLLASCAAGPPAGTGFDGTYAGPFVAKLAVSPESCPRTDTGLGRMVIRGGDARIDVIRGGYFSGHVAGTGELTMISGQERLAFISGRIVNGTYVAQGSGTCQYDVHLQRQAG